MRRLRTIYAVFLKDLTQMLRYPSWFIQLIIWPLIFPLLYIMSAIGLSGPDMSGIEAFKNATGTGSYAGFIVVGTMAWMWVNTTMWSFGTYLREEQTRGTLESNWLCPINKFDLLIGGGLVSVFQAVFISLVSVIEYRFIYGIHFTGSILQWVFIFIIMMPGVYGLGALFASIILWLKEANAAVNVARGVMMILCGITFPIAIMPEWMRFLSKGIPFTYGIEAARQVMVNGEGLKGASFNIMMCLVEGFIILMLGRILFMAIENKVKESGSLERF
ncbi:ABC transporter permease [Clostridium swellfunianum]|uniref:ABC transporter permease n=1 Tax=Clostridium swellfunianum TaxID=1367462 RepID=UPI002030B035|nr:ABC transporter permease [Clostridium swellfunianum]MCM0649298.1 ABC transporter permease [Clostridium swellfunianum]